MEEREILHESINCSLENYWIPYFTQNRTELMVACRLNPSTMCIAMTNNEVYDADKFLLDEVSNSSQISQQTIANRNIWCGNGNPSVQQNELVSFINSTIGISTNPTSFDLWSFWQQNKKRWPKLYSFAMNIYHIPASSASTERQFSKAKRIANSLRLAMSPQKLEDQIMVSNNSEITKEIFEKTFNL